jgi:hypothetical protein
MAQLLHSPLRGSFITSRRPIQCKTPSATRRLAAAAASTECARPMNDGNAVACAKALDEAKHHWIIPPLS